MPTDGRASPSTCVWYRDKTNTQHVCRLDGDPRMSRGHFHSLAQVVSRLFHIAFLDRAFRQYQITTRHLQKTLLRFFVSRIQPEHGLIFLVRIIAGRTSQTILSQSVARPAQKSHNLEFIQCAGFAHRGLCSRRARRFLRRDRSPIHDRRASLGYRARGGR